MVNCLLISPQYPDNYWKFAEALTNNHYQVFGIGDTPFFELSLEIKRNLKVYYFLPNLSDYQSLKAIVQHIVDIFGPLDFIESHNEHWLLTDARLRQDFKIDNGESFAYFSKFKAKSEMKQAFLSANIKVAPYSLINEDNDGIEFLKKYGFPAFVKPNIGVGSSDSYKINSFEEWTVFLNNRKKLTYILEPFLNGTIVSFDGISTHNSDVLIAFSHVFPCPNYAITSQGKEDYYYTLPKVPDDLTLIGQKAVKALSLPCRFFHLEFFRLECDHPLLGFKQNDLIALEANLRPPGGYTLEMMNDAYGINIHQLWADYLSGKDPQIPINPHFYVIEVARRDKFYYRLSQAEILHKYSSMISKFGRFDKGVADNMGDSYFIAKFSTYPEVELFIEEILAK